MEPTIQTFSDRRADEFGSQMSIFEWRFQRAKEATIRAQSFVDCVILVKVEMVSSGVTPISANARAAGICSQLSVAQSKEARAGAAERAACPIPPSE